MSKLKMTVSAVALSVLIAGTLTMPVMGEETRVKIATTRVDANGCHAEARTFTTQIPSSDKLDRAYHGVLDGIEVVEISANGDHSFGNFVLVNNGTAITYELYAKGAGHWVDPLKVLGHKIGGGACVGAKGGWEAIEVYAHYK